MDPIINWRMTVLRGDQASIELVDVGEIYLDSDPRSSPQASPAPIRDTAFQASSERDLRDNAPSFFSHTPIAGMLTPRRRANWLRDMENFRRNAATASPVATEGRSAGDFDRASC